MADGGEGAFDGVGGSVVFPVLCRKVIEGEQHVAIFAQFGRGLGFRLPDVMEMAFGFGQKRRWHRVQHPARLDDHSDRWHSRSRCGTTSAVL